MALSKNKIKELIELIGFKAQEDDKNIFLQKLSPTQRLRNKD